MTMNRYYLELVLPGLPKTTNGKRAFGHWAQYHREATKWKDAVKLYLVSKKPPLPLARAKLTLLRGSSQEPDFDGLVSSFKHVIDALVEAGILLDDKVSNIGQPIYRWAKTAPKEGFIKIKVEEIEGEI